MGISIEESAKQNRMPPERRSLLAEKANRFRALHHGSRILLLANIWDVATARVVEQAGMPAVATTSAGIAFALGYPDGQRIARAEMLDFVSRIAKAVKVPVTADAEAGYGNRPEDAGITAHAVLEAGAVGMNLEDGTEVPAHPLTDMQLQKEKIAAVREAAATAGVPLVLNARTDVYLSEVGPPERRYDETLLRLAAYRDAGADCVFAPGIRDSTTIQRLVVDLRCPLNILAGPGSPSISELEKIGVARVSLGSSPMRATLGLLSRIVKEVSEIGSYLSLEDAPSHNEVNQLMAGRSGPLNPSAKK
jgi:2-methylisocitrate lyase-like PEP mutase family enzyme